MVCLCACRVERVKRINVIAAISLSRARKMYYFYISLYISRQIDDRFESSVEETANDERVTGL